MFARKVETGEAVWVYQMTPFDQWDYDGINENIITDMEIDGKKREGVELTSTATVSPMCSIAPTALCSAPRNT